MSKSMKKIVIFLLTAFTMLSFVFAINSFKPVYAAVQTTDAIVVKDGAEIRLDDFETEEKDETGIRFTVNVDTAKVATLLTDEAYQGYTAEYGVALLPTRFLQGNELDVEGTYVYNEKTRTVLKIALEKVASTANNIDTYYAVLTKIPSIEYETDITARAFVKLTNGESVIYKQATQSVARAIGQVLTTCYNDPEYELGDDRPYYEQLLTKNLGTVSFDKDSYTLFKNSKNDKAITEDVTVYGNKYGFELDLNSEYLDENAVSFAYGTEDVANYENGEFLPVSGGETTATLTVDGKTASTSIKVETEADLASTLGTDEIAAFDHKGYETMIEGVASADTTLHEVSVGDYFGKTGVVKVSGETFGGMSLVKIDLPTAFAAGTVVTIQMYVVHGGVNYGSLGLSGSATGVVWGSPMGGDQYSLQNWENFVVTAPLGDSLYLVMGVVGVTFEYYISSIMVGDQILKIVKDELVTTLADDEVAKYDNEKYLQLISYGVNLSSANTTAEIVDDPLDNSETPRKVLKISGTNASGWGKIYLNLPKKINGTFTMEYRMVGSSAGAGSIWSIMDAAEGWGSWVDAYGDSTTPWTTLTNGNWNGQEKIVIGLNQMVPFEIYIAKITTEVDKAANRELYNEILAEKLVDNQLATFDEIAYLNYVDGQDLEYFNAEIVDDPLGEKGKVLHVTVKSLAVAQFGTPRLVLFLPKVPTLQNTVSYMVTIEGADNSANAWGIMLPGATAYSGGTWDLGLKTCTNVETWTNWPIGGVYAGLDYIVIGINNPQVTFHFYISGVLDGWVN